MLQHERGRVLQLRLKGLRDKLVRTNVHMFFKEAHGLPALVTDTVAGTDGAMEVRVMSRGDLRATMKGYGCFGCRYHGNTLFLHRNIFLRPLFIVAL